MFEEARLEFPLIEPLTELTADRVTAMIIGTSLGGVVYEETLGGAMFARGVYNLINVISVILNQNCGTCCNLQDIRLSCVVLLFHQPTCQLPI